MESIQTNLQKIEDYLKSIKAKYRIEYEDQVLTSSKPITKWSEMYDIKGIIEQAKVLPYEQDLTVFVQKEHDLSAFTSSLSGTVCHQLGNGNYSVRMDKENHLIRISKKFTLV